MYSGKQALQIPLKKYGLLFKKTIEGKMLQSCSKRYYQKIKIEVRLGILGKNCLFSCDIQFLTFVTHCIYLLATFNNVQYI